MGSRSDQIYLAVKYHPDHRNAQLIETITDAFGQQGMRTVCVARDYERWGEVEFGPGRLMELALGEIRESAAVVVEYSEKGVGLGIEAGFAAASGIPVFVLHKPGADISTTLRGIATAVIEYEDESALMDVAETVAAGIKR